MSETEGDRLFQIRVALGATPRRPESQPQFAERIGYDASTISRIERGEFKMSREFAEAASGADPLDRGPAWLLYGILTIKGDPPRVAPGTPNSIPIIGEANAKEKPTPLSKRDNRGMYETLRDRVERKKKGKKRKRA